MSAALRLRAHADAEVDRESDAAFVLSLRARGVFDRAVLSAMERVPREVFAPRRYADLARSDVALPLACGQTMTSPAVVAAMLAALDVRPGHRVLEVGTGSGYVTALLSRMGAEVHSVERRATLAESASHRLASAGFGADVSLVCGAVEDHAVVVQLRHRVEASDSGRAAKASASRTVSSSTRSASIYASRRSSRRSIKHDGAAETEV